MKPKRILSRWWIKLLLFLSVIGPGFITANVDNDAGGIFTYSQAGAQFGYALLWTMLPITISLIVIQEMCARMGAVTGKGLSDLIREEFGIRATFLMMFALVIVNFGNVITEFLGIAGSLELFGVNRYISVPVCAVIVWLIVVKGTYKSVEKVFLGASFFYIAYIIAGDEKVLRRGLVEHHTDVLQSIRRTRQGNERAGRWIATRIHLGARGIELIDRIRVIVADVYVACVIHGYSDWTVQYSAPHEVAHLAEPAYLHNPRYSSRDRYINIAGVGIHCDRSWRPVRDARNSGRGPGRRDAQEGSGSRRWTAIRDQEISKPQHYDAQRQRLCSVVAVGVGQLGGKVKDAT